MHRPNIIIIIIMLNSFQALYLYLCSHMLPLMQQHWLKETNILT